jgi:hypothetical protein
MLAALEAQLELLADIERDSDQEESSEEREHLQQAIDEIIARGSDKGLAPSFLSIDAGNRGYYTLAAGYRADFAPLAVGVFVDDLQDRIESADEADDGDDSDSMLDLREQLSKAEELLKRDDIEDESYVKAFFDLAYSYEERHSQPRPQL